MQDSRFYRVLPVCVIMLLLSIQMPAAAQPSDNRVFLPMLSRPQLNRLAYFGLNNDTAYIGVVDVNAGTRTEATFLTTGYWPTSLTWSPTNASLAFIEQDCGEQFECYPTAVVIARADGQPTRLSGTYDFPKWSPDGTKLAFSGITSLYQLHADGSGLTTLASGDSAFSRLTWSPDGQQLAYVSGDDDRLLSLLPLAGGDSRQLLSNVVNYLWAPTGDLLATEQLSGAVRLVNVATGATTLVDTNSTLIGWSPDGAHLVFNKTDSSGRLFLVGRDGGVPQELGAGIYPYWSPDGTKLALQSYDAHPLEVLDIATNTRRTLPVHGSIRDWSPDGSVLAVWEGVNESRSLIVPVDGGEPTVIEGVEFAGGLEWSPDSGWLSILNRVQTPDGIVGVRLLAAPRSGSPVLEVLPGPYSFRLEAFTWLPNQ